jgi:xanthine dehydrogenase small subunit
MRIVVIEFYLNGQPQKLDAVDPNMSVLAYLRTKMALTGTKEGCASGDCGACTVAIGSIDPQHPDILRYDNINSCIAVVGSLHGKHLVTVDALKSEPPHPVQQAMVEHHAAQCGFCTPGIVMSLFTVHQSCQTNDQPPEMETLLDALSGNLCRCTGYRPILAAAATACLPDPSQHGNPIETDWLNNLAMRDELIRIARQHGSLNDEKNQRYESPKTLAELRALRTAHPDARLIAGGTDLMLEVTQQLNRFEHLIALEGVDELHQMEVRSDGLYLGAAMTYRALLPTLAGPWPTIGHLLKRLGSSQIRNRGTLGGNIGNASPIGDMPPILIALGAEVELDSADGLRRLPLQDFFLGYKRTALRAHEFIRGVFIPAHDDAAIFKVYKISKRFDDDISAVLGAFWVKQSNDRVIDCRLAYGGMAAIPKRATGAEQALMGRPWDETSVRAAVEALAQDFTPMSDVRASATYRTQIAGNLLWRAWLESRSDTDSHPSTSTYPLTIFDYAQTISR